MGRRLFTPLALVLALVLLGSACAPGTDGIVPIEVADTESDQDFGNEPIVIDLPTIPAIVLPDLVGFGQYDTLFEDRVRGLDFQPVDGVEVVEGECLQGETIYSADETSDVFDTVDFDKRESLFYELDEATGVVTYRATNIERGSTIDRVTTEIVTAPDGSGTFLEEGRDHQLSIEAAADGSGKYFAQEDLVTGGEVIITIDASAAGTGTYTRNRYDSTTRTTTLTTITIDDDGAGRLFHQEPGKLITVDARPSGTGEFFFEEDGRVVTVRLRADGVWEYTDTSFGRTQSVVVAPDGSGRFHDRSPGRTIRLDFDADGRSHRHDAVGPPVIVSDSPVFLVADRFPPLGTLARIEPPCTTVLRFDSALLFADNDYAVLPEAQAVLAELAPALVEANQPFAVNGHTDARGSDEYNQELSELRALEVAALLHNYGVPVELITINGFGETQPVAPNFTDDGEDDEIGQSQNRRVEIVIGNQETT